MDHGDIGGPPVWAAPVGFRDRIVPDPTGQRARDAGRSGPVHPKCRRRLPVRHPGLTRTLPTLMLWTLAIFLVGVSITADLLPSTRSGQKVGLVLGGGGGRGLAHVGVLHWLEENRIPVDLVVGASMGGLVGGFYATGWNPVELEALLHSLDWEELFQASPPHRYLTYRRKEDAAAYTARFELGWKNGLSTPAGLNAGHFIGLLLDRLTVPYFDLTDFDTLPIPYRCVATDLENGQQVVLGQGSLNLALRATMAIPGVFNAVEVDGRLLVDGGVLNNVPADIAKELGADLVIAVDVGTPLRGRDKLNSLVGVADQTLSILILESVRRSIRFADILLAPDLGEHGTLDFGDFDGLIRKGYEAAEAKGSLLRTLSLSEAEWNLHLEQRRARVRTELPQIRQVSVSGVDAAQGRRVARTVSAQIGRPLELVPLEESLTTLYGEGRTDAVGYHLQGNREHAELNISIQEKGFGPPFIRFGLNIDGSDVGDVGFGLRSRTTFFDLGRPGAETRFDLDLGGPSRLAAEHYLPISGPWFASGSAFSRRRNGSFFADEIRAADFREIQTGVGLDLGYGFGRRQDEFRAGIAWSHLDSRIRVGDPALLSPLKGGLGAFRLRWTHNSLDNPTVPSEGRRWQMQALQLLDTPGDIPLGRQVAADFAAFHPIGRRGRVFFRSEAGLSFDGRLPPSLAFSLGGPLRLGAYGEGRFRGSRLLFGSGGFLREIGGSAGPFGARTYVGGWYEGGSAWNRGEPIQWRHLGSAGFVLDSVFGPIFIGSSWGEGGRHRLYFSVGYIF